MARRRRASVLALALLLAAGAAGAQPALRAPLTAEVRFADALTGAPLAQVTPGVPFAVELAFRAEVGSVPADLAPLAWVRQRDDTDLPCAESAAAYRAAGRAALGSVDLNGTVLGVVTRDGAFTILDPQRSLGSANLLAARRFQPAPTSIGADPRRAEFLLSLPGTGARRGEVVAISAHGAARVLADGLDRPGALVAARSGGAWLIERGTGDLLRLGGASDLRRLPLGARAIAGDGGGEALPARRVAVLHGTLMSVLEPDGAVLAQVAAPEALAVGLTPDAALWLSPGGLNVLWLDALAAPAVLALPGQFDRLAVGPDGRMVYLFAAGRTGFAVLDLARGRVVQGADTESPVAEVAFLSDTAVLRLADQSAVGVMDLRTVAPGTEAIVGRVALGPPRPAAETAGARLLVPLTPEPAMLAIHAESYTGFVVDRRNAVSGKPPMEALRLRGGTPMLVQPLDRGLRRVAGDRFQVSASLPAPGDWELVVSTGIGQGAFCAAVPAPPAPSQAVSAPGLIQPRPEGTKGLRLVFTRAGGEPASGVRGVVDFATLTGNWRMRRPFATDQSGITLESYDLRAHLPVVVTPRPGPGAFQPLVIEAMP